METQTGTPTLPTLNKRFNDEIAVYANSLSALEAKVNSIFKLNTVQINEKGDSPQPEDFVSAFGDGVSSISALNVRLSNLANHLNNII